MFSDVFKERPTNCASYPKETRVSFQLVFCSLSSAVFYRQQHSLSCRRTAEILLGAPAETCRIIFSQAGDRVTVEQCPARCLCAVSPAWLIHGWHNGDRCGRGTAQLPTRHRRPSYHRSSDRCEKGNPSRLSPFLCRVCGSTREQQPPHPCFGMRGAR